MPKPISNADYIMGFDFGTRRIGVAVGARINQTASPLSPIKAVNGVPNWAEVLALLTEWEVVALVVGLPTNMDGTSQNTTFAAKRFANKLSAKCQLPAYLIDERLTTIEARQMIHDHSLDCDVDCYSAKLILETWLRSDKTLWIPSN